MKDSNKKLIKEIEEKALEMRKENLKHLRSNIGLYEKKIKNFISRYDLEDKQLSIIKNKISTDELFAYQFIKDPYKQNFVEKYVSDVIKEIDNVKNFVDHKNAVNLFLKDGQVIKTKEVGCTKSLDYTFSYKGKTCYCTQKYIRESGGAQDNQCRDVESFLKHAQKNKYKKELFIAIIDGEYFTEEKINYLIENYQKDNVLVSTTYLLEEVLNDNID